MGPRAFAIMAVRRRVQETEDDLHRARIAYRGLSTEGMRAMHGGQTRAQVLAGYERQYEEASASLKWLEGK